MPMPDEEGSSFWGSYAGHDPICALSYFASLVIPGKGAENSFFSFDVFSASLRLCVSAVKKTRPFKIC